MADKALYLIRFQLPLKCGGYSVPLPAVTPFYKKADIEKALQRLFGEGVKMASIYPYPFDPVSKRRPATLKSTSTPCTQCGSGYCHLPRRNRRHPRPQKVAAAWGSI
jgi:hypothetical protein